MKKFKNAKSISSAQFREAQDVMNADTDPSRERLRSDFSGASAISSDAFFGKPLREREPLCLLRQRGLHIVWLVLCLSQAEVALVAVLAVVAAALVARVIAVARKRECDTMVCVNACFVLTLRRGCLLWSGWASSWASLVNKLARICPRWGAR